MARNLGRQTAVIITAVVPAYEDIQQQQHRQYEDFKPRFTFNFEAGNEQYVELERSHVGRTMWYAYNWVHCKICATLFRRTTYKAIMLNRKVHEGKRYEITPGERLGEAWYPLLRCPDCNKIARTYPRNSDSRRIRENKGFVTRY